MKIVCIGPSGAGKTTLAKWIAEEYGLEFVSSSAWDLLSSEDKSFLKKEYDYKPEGHLNVIRKSFENANFTRDFQVLVEAKRAALLASGLDDMITDRSPIDNVTYYLLQASMMLSDEFTAQFIEAAVETWEEHVDAAIFVNFVNKKIEDNNSRISKVYYQRMTNAVFNYVYTEYFEGKGVPVLHIDYWDLEKRKINVKAFIDACINQKTIDFS